MDNEIKRIKDKIQNRGIESLSHKELAIYKGADISNTYQGYNAKDEQLENINRDMKEDNKESYDYGNLNLDNRDEDNIEDINMAIADNIEYCDLSNGFYYQIGYEDAYETYITINPKDYYNKTNFVYDQHTNAQVFFKNSILRDKVEEVSESEFIFIGRKEELIDLIKDEYPFFEEKNIF